MKVQPSVKPICEKAKLWLFAKTRATSRSRAKRKNHTLWSGVRLIHQLV